MKSVNLADPSLGQLSELVRDHMLKGKTGHGEYSFEGVGKLMAYSPLKLGNRTYSIAATGPAEEFFVMAERKRCEAACPRWNHWQGGRIGMKKKRSSSGSGSAAVRKPSP